LAGDERFVCCLTGDLDRHRERLVQALDAIGVVVAPAGFSERGLVGFSTQVREASNPLAESRTFISGHHGELNAYRIRYFAADSERAEPTLG
jgi:hypothetical protein